MTATEARILIACERAWTDPRWVLHVRTQEYDRVSRLLQPFEDA